MSAPGQADLHNYPFRHFVYRFYDGSGRLLYVGSTYNVVARKAAHRRTDWFTKVRRQHIEEYPNYKAAQAAEREAIRTESPLINVAGKPKVVNDSEVAA